MWGYRLRTTLQLQRGEDGRVRAGYFARGSHRLVPVRQCPILAPGLESILPDLAQRLEADPATELPARLDLLCGDDGAVTASPVVGELQHGEVTLAVGDLSYRLDARCFFQAHRGLVERLVSTTVGPWEGERAFDLYAGVGLFSLPLARRYRAVTAVEGDRVAARYARTNARRNKLPHVEVVGQAVESWARELPPDLDRVVVDPPRAGLAVPLRRALLDHPAARLTYVSCHPATLARDLRELLAAYRLESLALFDLFPQSGHMESVAQLVRL
jgi:23S rRNA (uracil1939-C5)-methyltransferase